MDESKNEKLKIRVQKHKMMQRIPKRGQTAEMSKRPERAFFTFPAADVPHRSNPAAAGRSNIPRCSEPFCI
jgi:hypothetical protein